MRIGQFDLARAVLAQGRKLGLDSEPVITIARQLGALPGAAPDTPGEAAPSTDYSSADRHPDSGRNADSSGNRRTSRHP